MAEKPTYEELEKRIQELEQSASEHKRVEGALRESKEKHRILLEEAADPIFSLSPGGQYTFANKAFAERVGMHISDISGKTIWDVFPKEEADKRFTALDQVFKTGAQKITEVCVPKPEGNSYYLTTITPIKDADGRTLSAICSSKDISILKQAAVALQTTYNELKMLAKERTAKLVIANESLQKEIAERKQAEAELKYRKFQLDSVFNNLDSIIYIADMDSYEILFMNNYMKKEFGEDLTGKICWKSFHENQDGPCKFCTNDKLIDTDGNPTEPYVWEIYNQKLDNWFLLHDQAIPWEHGRLVRMEIATNISDHKKTEIALEETAELNRKIISESPVGITIYDESGQCIVANESVGKILGASKEKILEQNCFKIESWNKTKLLAALKEAIKEGTSKRQEAQVTTTFGKNVIIDCYFVPFTKESKTCLMIVTTDITARKRREEQIKKSLKEKDVLLQEIHHRVKNNMQVISSLLTLQAMDLKDEKLKEALEDSRNRIQAMSFVHEKLYGSENLATIDIEAYISRLTEYLMNSHGKSSSEVELKIEIENVFLDIVQATPLGLIINELVSNSLKHAFPESRKYEIRINLKQIDQDKVKLIVKDTGVGLPEDLDWKNSDSLGLRLVCILAEDQLEGTLDLARNNGTQFTLRFINKKDKHKRF